MSTISAINSENDTGPKTEPWGTPLQFGMQQRDLAIF